ncbi:MAG TPA: hypothetical protein DG754_10795 [Bacteroidales bacterium]|jgi:predicted Zn-dependent peptidase|nr:hypothetical protein [Bacteroidales bacterium]
MKRFFLFLPLFLAFTLNGQISTFQLENGLTVIVNEDSRTPSVFGSIVVKAGSVDDPSDATGLAHYLEHMLFKGSKNVGTTDWEKEEVHYNKIVDLYDQLGKTPEAERDAIQQKINEESLLAGKYTINNEFSNLIQAIGGTALNAATGNDMTYYHNVFPSFMLKKWLVLQADRFENPVFRGFQAELETVYEEKNMSSDNFFTAIGEEFNQLMYGTSNPYSRPIIGLTEHLKTPSLSKLKEFYETFYVPSNMALVLSGDVKEEEVRKLLEETLGKWKPGKDVQRDKIEQQTIQKKTTIKKKLSPMPILLLGYNGATTASDDTYKLNVLSGVLNNGNNTGLLDKIVLDGDVQQISVMVSSLRQAGSIMILGIPEFDGAQGRYESLRGVELAINKVFKKLMEGNLEDWLVEAVKNELIMNFELSKESNYSYGQMLMREFVNDRPISELEKYVDIINGITKADIVELAKKYFDVPYIVFQSLIGEPKKDKISKPDYKPIVPATGRSKFAVKWIDEEVEVPPFKPIDFNKDLSMTELAPGVKLFHAENPENDIFSLYIVYGVGSNKIPELSFSVDLMNRAGIMALHTPYELKKEFSDLGCKVYFSNDRDNTYIRLIGKEANLAKACQLLSKSYLLPSIDEKQLNSLIGGELGQRQFEKSEKTLQSVALNQYLRYGEKSPYLNRMSNSEVLELTVSKLAAGFIKATQYETSVHYTGKLSYNKVKDLLVNNLAFPSNLKPSVSNEEIPTVKYDETTILLFSNSKVRQSDIYLYVPGEKYEVNQKTIIDGFNQYFGGGFNGLVLQELRELRSLAYTAEAGYSIPSVPNQNTRLTGYIGTQGDKTHDAVNEFTKLITNMPEHPERISNIKNFLEQATVNATPSIRQRTMVVESWMDYGYDKDPRTEWVSKYKELEFTDLLSFYNTYIKSKPIGIAIVANGKNVKGKDLKDIGTVKRVNSSKIFKY